MVDANTEEIDRALLQLGLVGTKVLERDVNKWKSVAETSRDSDEEGDGLNRSEEVGIDTIFEENANSESQTADLPKRMKLEECNQDSVDEAEQWRALLMKDRVRLSEKLESSSVIASNLSDKPKDYVPDESPIRRDTYDESSRHSTPKSPSTKSDSEDDAPIGNPPLAPIGNPPLVDEADTEPIKSYRQRAVEAAEAEMDPDAINPDDIDSLHSSDQSDSSSSSEEGEITDDDDDDDNKNNEDHKSDKDSEEKDDEVGNLSGDSETCDRSPPSKETEEQPAKKEEADESVDKYSL